MFTYEKGLTMKHRIEFAPFGEQILCFMVSLNSSLEKSTFIFHAHEISLKIMTYLWQKMHFLRGDKLFYIKWIFRPPNPFLKSVYFIELLSLLSLKKGTIEKLSSSSMYPITLRIINIL